MNEIFASTSTEAGVRMEWNSKSIDNETSGSPTVSIHSWSRFTSDGYDLLSKSFPPFSVDGATLITWSFDWNSSLESTAIPPSLNETESQLQSLEERIGSICLGVLLCGLCLITFIGNAMVLHAVRMEPRLQTVSNMFIVSLAIADLVVGAAVMPIGVVYILTERWMFGVAICQLWTSIDYTASTASILNLFILSLDRYWSVTSLLKYLRQRTKKRGLMMISFVWFFSFLWIIPIVGWHHFVNNGVRTVRHDVCDTEYAQNTALKMTTAILNYYLPLAVMYALYTKIFVEIRHRSALEIGRRVDLNDIKRHPAPLLNANPSPSLDLGRRRTDSASRSSDRATAAAGTNRFSLYGRCCSDAAEADHPHHRQRIQNGFCSASSHTHMNAADINLDSDDVLSLLHAANRSERESFGRERLKRKRRNDRTHDASSSSSSSSSQRLHLTTCWYCRRRDAINCRNDEDDDDCVGGRNDLPSKDTRGAGRGIGKDRSRPVGGGTGERCDQRTYFKKNPGWWMKQRKQSKMHSNGCYTSVHRRPRGIDMHSADVRDRNQIQDGLWTSDLRLRQRTARSHETTSVQGFRRNPPMTISGTKKLWPPLRNHSKLSRIVCTGNKSTLQVRKESKAQQNTEMGRKSGGEGGRGYECSSVSGPQTKRHVVNGHLSALSKEIKAARQLGVIMGVFTVCFLPYFVCFMVVAFCETCVDSRLMTTVTWIGYLNSALNPFIYPLCNLKFRIQFRKMLSLHGNGACSSSGGCRTGREGERGSAFVGGGAGQSVWSSSSPVNLHHSSQQLRRTQSLLILQNRQRPSDRHLTHI